MCVCNMFTSMGRTTHVRELVDGYPSVHVPSVAWRHAQCVAQAPHAYTCRTDRDLCHWLRSVHRRVYRPFHACGSSKRAPLLRLDTISRSIRSTYRERDRRSFTPVDCHHLLDRQHVLFPTYSLSIKATRLDISSIIITDCRNFIWINISELCVSTTNLKKIKNSRLFTKKLSRAHK